MRASRVREKLAAGKPVLVTKMNTLDPMIADIVGLIGFDCLWLCNEHTGIDWDRMGHLIRTAAMNGMDTLIRVSKGSYSDYIRPLELSATGIMVPHCMSGAEAREIGQATRFQPIGRRALDGGNCDGLYCLVPVHDYLRLANQNTFVVVQIEDPEALKHIEDIVAAPGVDVVFIGPGDLSHGLGDPGNITHPRIQDAIVEVARACRRHNKHWGLPVTSETAPRYLDLGARFLSAGADVLGLGAYFRDVRDRFAKIGFEFEAKV
ncbi:MAG: aldolase/citrate lyase family protein [Bryobacteraceae bacterium]